MAFAVVALWAFRTQWVGTELAWYIVVSALVFGVQFGAHLAEQRRGRY